MLKPFNLIEFRLCARRLSIGELCVCMCASADECSLARVCFRAKASFFVKVFENETNSSREPKAMLSAEAALSSLSFGLNEI